MIEYVKSEQKENVYCILTRYRQGGYDVDYETEFEEPKDGIVVGTFAIYESGYEPITGTIYDEVIVEFYKK